MGMTATCTVTVSATGEKCGEPAVFTFTGSGGEEFGECAKHSTAHIGSSSTGEHCVGEHVTVHRYGKAYTATVSKVGKRGAAWATFTYGNGTTRTVRV